MTCALGMNAVTEDGELVERLERGDRAALRRIYEKYRGDLLRLGGCIMANWADAEDCLHDLFVSLAANRAHVRPGGNLKGYLVTAMANRSRDRLRRKKHEHPPGTVAGGPELVDGEPTPAAALIGREKDEQLFRAIGLLPLEQRTVISLRLHGELTFEEIAELEKASHNTIRSRYRYALDKLRSSLSAGVE